MLSTNCNPNEQVTVQRRSKAPPHIVDVAIPTPVHLYNHSMGSVDLNGCDRTTLQAILARNGGGLYFAFIVEGVFLQDLIKIPSFS